MFFGFDPFNFLNPLQQRPQRNRNNPQNQQMGHQNFIDQIGNFLNNGFMNPQRPPQNPNQQRNQQPRPRYHRPQKQKQKKTQKKEQKKFEQPVYHQGTGMYWKNLGNQAYKKNDFEIALLHYTKAIELNNTESVFFSNRARCYKNLNKLQLALQDAQVAVQLDVQNIKAHLLCGQILAQVGKVQKDQRKVINAITRLTKALTLCSSQNKSSQFQKQLGQYIYRAKKLLWYLKFNEIKQNRIKAIKEYKNYLESDKQLQSQQRQKKLEDFLNAVDQNVMFQIPDYLICKITLDIMEEPVTTDSGQTYERSAIQQHIQRNGKTDPFTRKPINGQLYPSIAIKKAIQDFLNKNPWAYQYFQGETLDDIKF